MKKKVVVSGTRSRTKRKKRRTRTCPCIRSSGSPNASRDFCSNDLRVPFSLLSLFFYIAFLDACRTPNMSGGKRKANRTTKTKIGKPKTAIRRRTERERERKIVLNFDRAFRNEAIGLLCTGLDRRVYVFVMPREEARKALKTDLLTRLLKER